MYPEEVVKPMKLELTSNGFKELSNDDDIKNMIENGSSVIMVNSCLLYTSPSPRDS